MDKIKRGRIQSLVAWRGVRACVVCLIVVLIALSQVNITAFADEADYTFNISQGNIVISPGSNSGTIKVNYGSSQQKNNIPGNQAIIITGSSTGNTVKVIDGVSVNIALSGVNIYVAGTSQACALDLDNAGAVRLSLRDSTTNIFASGEDRPGIRVPNAAKLTIDGNGALIASGGSNGSGIGRDGNVDIEILSGKIWAKGGDNSAAIGGSKLYGGGKITIRGGEVYAEAGRYGAGIGGGHNGAGGTINIYGGKITAKGGHVAAGIGGGHNGAGGTINIHNGDITATGGLAGAGIGGGTGKDGGTITIDNGKISATGGIAGAGIGGGHNGVGGNITINGGEINATGGHAGDGNGAGAGIGGGHNAAGGNITIYRGKVTATGGDDYDGAGAAAGIGGGHNGAGGTINIHNGDITATGGDNAAGIGGGFEGAGGNITIHGGKVTAKGASVGNDGGAGIGGGSKRDGGNITINGGDITAEGGHTAAGIGGGFRGTGGIITINSGKITATGGGFAAGIGGGYNNAEGTTITISGGDITAKGGIRGAGIGGGGNGAGGNITISGGHITAKGGALAPADEHFAAGIGSGTDGDSGTFSTGTNGSAVIYANDISHKGNQTSWSGVIFEKNNGKVYGTSVTPSTDFEIPSGYTLDIDSGTTLKVASDKKLTNKGTININDTAALTNNGTVENTIDGVINIEQGGTLTNNRILINNGIIRNKGTLSGTNPQGNGSIQTPPRINDNPQSQTVTAEGSVSFTVSAIGNPSPAYQWQEKTNDSDWRNIDNGTSRVYTIDPVSYTMNENKYRCIVTNDLGNTTSGEAILTVNTIQMSTPNPGIDYVAETLTGLTAGGVYKITAGGAAEVEIEANPSGEMSIKEEWFGKELLVKAKASDINHSDSAAESISIPNRPDIPSGLSGINETFIGENDGQIAGTTSQMEYKLSNDSNWTVCLESSTLPLAPGTYEVRVAATNNSFVSMPATIEIATGEVRTYTLNITAPTFEAVEYGYSQPGAKAITIKNTGNTISNVLSVTLSSNDHFELAGSGDSIDVGSSINSYTIQPKAGLSVGTYTAEITVGYTNSGTATKQVSFTVGKASQTAPQRPELETKTHNTVTLKEIQPNNNGAQAQYSIDSGNTWQDERVFTGLTVNTSYNFVARYKETADGQYKESDKSDITEISTDNAPSSGSDSTSSSGSNSAPSSGSDSASGSSSVSGGYGSLKTKSNNGRQNKSLLSLKVDTNGHVIITKSIALKTIERAKAEAKNGQEIVGKIAIETGTAAKSIKIIIKSDALTELVSSNINRFVLDTDTLIDLGFKAETLKELKSKTSGDTILNISKAEITSNEAKTAIGSRPVYDISILESKSGKETKVENLNGKTVSVSIPYATEKNEQSFNVYAVYADEQGKVQWLTKSSYDKDNKAVIFETDHFSVYGVGSKQDMPEFKDINNHWAKEDILFVAGRGILLETEKTRFSPDEKVTGGMFVTALGKLAQVDTESYKEDVKEDTYYTPYVNWAVEKGIVSGIGEDTFLPDMNMTREQMAVIMKKYAEKMGYTLPKTLEEMKFSDDEKISDWAKASVKDMQMTGILSGKKTNSFNPKGEATRAEVSAVLHRFVEIVIDPQTANGWTKNDSGQISYYKDGQAVKGWLKENGKTYWFNKKTAKMFSGGFKKIGGKLYYFYEDGTMAVNKVIDKKKIGPDGVAL